MSATPPIGICLDLDATLVTTSLWSMVAAAVDLVEELDVLTRATEEGDLPFARSVRVRCRLLDDVPVSEAARRASVAPLDGDVLACLATKVERVHIVTDVPRCWLGGIIDRLGVDVHATEVEVEGDRIGRVVEVVDKAAVVASLRDRYERVAVVGAHVGDVAMLEEADIRVAYGAHAPAAVRSLSQYWVMGGRALWQLSRPW